EPHGPGHRPAALDAHALEPVLETLVDRRREPGFARPVATGREQQRHRTEHRSRRPHPSLPAMVEYSSPVYAKDGRVQVAVIKARLGECLHTIFNPRLSLARYPRRLSGARSASRHPGAGTA